MLAIIGAGTLLAWQVVGSVHDVLHTSYGHTLLLKLALVTAALALRDSTARPRYATGGWVILDGDRATVRPFIYRRGGGGARPRHPCRGECPRHIQPRPLTRVRTKSAHLKGVPTP